MENAQKYVAITIPTKIELCTFKVRLTDYKSHVLQASMEIVFFYSKYYLKSVYLLYNTIIKNDVKYFRF